MKTSKTTETQNTESQSLYNAYKLALQTEIDQETANYALFSKINEAIAQKQFRDKPLTKRFETYMKKRLIEIYGENTLQCYLVELAGMYNLHVYLTQNCNVPLIKQTYAHIEGSNNTIRFFLCYDTDKTLRLGTYTEQHSGFNYYNSCFGHHASMCIAHKQKILDTPELLNKLWAIAKLNIEIKRNMNAASLLFAELQEMPVAPASSHYESLYCIETLNKEYLK